MSEAVLSLKNHIYHQPVVDEGEEKTETEPIMTSRPSIEMDDPPSVKVVLSPSHQRGKSVGGLSELSKQLRILQAKNEAQSVEINRLERQLRILAELQGISVADLRKTLEDACANEAFGELQHRVAKLRAELEAATLAKQKELGAGCRGRDTAGPQIANLELRVGELEEVEEKNQREIHHLYEDLRHERARATRLELESQENKQELEELLQRLNKQTARANNLEATFQERLRQHQLEQAKKMQEMAKLAREAEAKSKKGLGSGGTCDADAMEGRLSSTSKSNIDRNDKKVGDPISSSTREAESELFSLILKEKTEELRAAEERFRKEQEKWMKQLKEKEDQLREAQRNKQVEKDQMALTIKEMKDVDSQSELRLAQFKARFNVQDERINDMEQQLSSLYTAFGIIKEERDVDDKQRAALESNLNEADAVMARQVESVEKRRSQRNVRNSSSSLISPEDLLDDDDVPRTIRTPTSTAMSSPGMMSPIATARMVDSSTPASTTALPYTPAASHRPSGITVTPRSSSSFPTQRNARGASLIKGTLMVKSKSVMRKWKSKYCKLYLLRNHYQWEMDGKSYTLGTGISKVEFNPNHPLSFSVYTNPFDEMAPVVHAAASNEQEYHRWMAALTLATTGREYDGPSQETQPLPLGTPGSLHSHQRSSANSVVSGLSSEEREAMDLERALRLSQTMT